jgi:hypothetical protein
MEQQNGKIVVRCHDHVCLGRFGHLCLVPSLGQLIVYMLVLEGGLLLSERLQWFPFNTHKGRTVLIALASLGVFFMFIFLWGTLCLLFRQRFQFSLLSLLMLAIVVAIPCSWFAVEMNAARKQAEVYQRIEAYSIVGYEWQVEVNGQVRWQLNSDKTSTMLNTAPPPPRLLCDLLGTDFLSRIALVDFASGVTEDEIEPIQCLSQLQWLNLGQVEVTDESLQCIKGMTQLKFLNIAESHITDNGLKIIKGLKNLKWLCAYKIKITDAGLRNLEGLTQIKALQIADNRITDTGVQHLRGLTNLQVLELDNTQITDAGLKDLTGLTKLKVLTLSNTQVTDTGLKSLKALNGLEELWLEKTQVTDAGLDTLKGLTRLKRLLLTGCKATPDGVKELRKALPNCLINLPTEYGSDPGSQYNVW